jgi:hypothetical protein
MTMYVLSEQRVYVVSFLCRSNFHVHTQMSALC